MRKIFPSKYSSGSSSSSSCSSKPAAAKNSADGCKQIPGKRQSVVKQCSQDASLRNRREHWCPSCPSAGSEIRCDTPPSGDENAASNSKQQQQQQKQPQKQQQLPHTRLGLPDECQDKQILRPSIKAVSISPSPDHSLEWTSGLQDALDDLVAESRDDLSRKYVSEPTSPASSPPMIEKRRHASRPSSASSDKSRFVPVPEVDRNVYTADESTSFTHSMEFGSSSKLTKSLSRNSSDGPSIMSNPRSQSCDWSRGTTSDNFSHRDFSVDDISRESRRYISARAVAEKLAKAIRGSSSRTKDVKRPPPFPQTPTKSSESTSNQSSSNKASRDLRGALEQGRQADSLNNRKSDAMVLVSRTKPKLDVTQQNDFFHRQLELHKAKVAFVYDSLEERVLSADKFFAAAEAESISSEGDRTGKLTSREQDTLNRKTKKLQRERKDLARELLMEVRQRQKERFAVREMLEGMTRDMGLLIASLERDKAELQRKLEETQISEDECWLRDRVKRFAEEKECLEKELISVVSKENALRQKVREFEGQMIAHVTRVEDAERTIIELRESLAAGQKKLAQSEKEVEKLRHTCNEKQDENADLRNFCADHEKSIMGLWQSLNTISHDQPDQRAEKMKLEVLRLSEVEQALRRDLEAARQEASAARNELCALKRDAEDSGAHMRVNDQLKLLSDRLSTSYSHQRRQQEELKALEAVKTSLHEQNTQLKQKLDQGKDSQWLDKRAEVVQRKKKQGPLGESEGKQQTIDGLQRSISDMSQALNAQNVRIQRLTGRNEELLILYKSKEKELLELQATSRDKPDESSLARVQQLQDKLRHLQGELETQKSLSDELRRELVAKESEVAQLKFEQVRRGGPSDETLRLRRILDGSRERVSQLEVQVKEMEMKLSVVQAELRRSVQEAEEMGREALRSGAEAEMLKRKVQQLEEDVLLKEGQLAIMRRTLNEDDDDDV